MSKSQYVAGLRAVEQLLSADSSKIHHIYAEYQTANPRVQAVISAARNAGIEIQAANRSRLTQISGESRHQGIVAEVRRSTVLDEAGLRTMVEERLQNAPRSSAAAFDASGLCLSLRGRRTRLSDSSCPHQIFRAIGSLATKVRSHD